MAVKWMPQPAAARTYAYSFFKADSNPAADWNSWAFNFGTTWKVASNVMRSNEELGASLATLMVPETATTQTLSPNQFSRVWLNTVDTGGSFASGYGPCVRIFDKNVTRGYRLHINANRSSIFYALGGDSWIGEGGADGDIWELQVWGGQTITYLRIFRNWRMVGNVVVPDSYTASGRDRGGYPGITENHAAGGFGTWGGGITRWEGGELPDMVPMPFVDQMMGQVSM